MHERGQKIPLHNKLADLGQQLVNVSGTYMFGRHPLVATAFALFPIAARSHGPIRVASRGILFATELTVADARHISWATPPASSHLG